MKTYGNPIINTTHFAAWSEAWGLLREDEEPQPSALYGFITDEPKVASIPERGSCYGYVVHGHAVTPNGIVRAGQFFQLPNGCAHLVILGCVFVVQRYGYLGYAYVGGPIEKKGRMRYIDGCSDTLLVPPMLKGEPCFNHLHFPDRIDQTMHTHPSTRFGAVAGGEGWCWTPIGDTKLVKGLIFHIPKDGFHRFSTEHSHMDVIAYHPDSDFGPTHEVHPMINRTWVDGKSIDNTEAKHLSKENVINPWLPPALS
jgi:hypothetical protein